MRSREGRSSPEPLYPPESLYVHVPFCRKRCAYCDFLSCIMDPSSGGLGEMYLRATLGRAAELSERFGARSYRTVYVGGGTPTVLGSRLLGALLEGIGRLAGSPLEWTVEANPESLDAEMIAVIVGSGANRASIGVQSLDARCLNALGRLHDAKDALAAVEHAAGAGLSVSADLIAAVPTFGERRPRRDMRAEIRRLLDAGASHLSIYDLTIEEDTELGRASARGELAFPPDEEAYEERREAEELLLSGGFSRYEVSNYAPPGLESVHNLCYWRMESYVGAGPGAVSTIALGAVDAMEPIAEPAALRIEEGRDVESYASADPGASETEVSLSQAAFEAVMMGFRSSFGPDPAAFRDRFGIELRYAIPGTLASWSDRIVQGRPLPAAAGRGRDPGPALDGEGMDLLNRFLIGCLEEMESIRWGDRATSPPPSSDPSSPARR
jgi:oxygen-independent coproporphyrinogen-3 oxidase